MPKIHNPARSWWPCTPCGKRRFHSRAGAKAARRALPDSGRGLHVYRCPVTGEGFHLGHQPAALTRGDITRDQIAPKERP